MKRLIVASATAALLASTAYAQNQPSTSADPSQRPIASAPNAATTGGLTVAKSANMAIRFRSPQPAELMTSRLIGTDVYNRKNEKLGTIQDLSIENGNRLAGIVVSVGGFLGMGERYVMVEPSTVVVDVQNDAWKAFVDTDRDTLKNAPKFTYSETKS